MNEEKYFDRYEHAQQIKIDDKFNGERYDPMGEIPEEAKQSKKNVFCNLFKSKQAKKPFFSRNKNKLE